jgi:hypothetical protein
MAGSVAMRDAPILEPTHRGRDHVETSPAAERTSDHALVPGDVPLTGVVAGRPYQYRFEPALAQNCCQRDIGATSDHLKIPRDLVFMGGQS